MAASAAAIAAAKAAYNANKRRSLKEAQHRYAWVAQYEIESRELGLGCLVTEVARVAARARPRGAQLAP